MVSKTAHTSSAVIICIILANTSHSSIIRLRRSTDEGKIKIVTVELLSNSATTVYDLQ